MKTFKQTETNLYVFKHKIINSCVECPMSNYEGKWCSELGERLDDTKRTERNINCHLMKTGIASYLK